MIFQSFNYLDYSLMVLIGRHNESLGKDLRIIGEKVSVIG